MDSTPEPTPTVASSPARYLTHPFDSSRWDGFVFRPDDIVITAPSKCGTTWMQMICALLIFGTTDLPDRLTALSPCLEFMPVPLDQVSAQLDGQRHRRFIKSHVPLDGLPAAPGVTYIVVGRDPRDVVTSLERFAANLSPKSVDEVETSPSPADQHARIQKWITNETPPRTSMATLRGVVHHLAGAWNRRDDPRIVLMHYADLSRDLEGQMRLLAGRLGIEVRDDLWPRLIEAATFSQMRRNARDLVPDEGNPDMYLDQQRFFHSGTSGQWRDMFTDENLAIYHDRLTKLAPAGLLHWLHHGAGS